MPLPLVVCVQAGDRRVESISCWTLRLSNCRCDLPPCNTAHELSRTSRAFLGRMTHASRSGGRSQRRRSSSDRRRFEAKRLSESPPQEPHGVRAATGSSAVQLDVRVARLPSAGLRLSSGGMGKGLGSYIVYLYADRARPPRGRSWLGAPCGVSGRRVACLVVGRRAARLGRAAERERPRQAQRARQRAPCCIRGPGRCCGMFGRRGVSAPSNRSGWAVRVCT